MPKSGLIMGLWAALFVLAGCAGQSEGGTATDAAEPRAMPELTEPWMALYSGGEGLRAAREPLQLGRALAQVTGGTWVVATPRPL
ncbi:MAG: hypothetical protein FJX77_07485, partial [Armatimonadetes bacterium]|nr:hypothetical protein [Armatimonadota bacterium]